MRRPLHFLIALASPFLIVTGLVACGGSSTAATQAADGTGPAAVVAQVDGTTITRGELSHWMSTLLGGDYDESIGRPAPRNLVSDPPDYPACISAIESLGPPKTTGESPQQLHTQTESKCKQLYVAAKAQALSYLINGLWVFKEAAKHGISVTDAEVKSYLEKVKAERYPTEKAFVSFLAGREWALSDELYLLKRDLFMTRLNAWREQTLKKTVKSTGLAFQRAVLELYAHELQQWPSQTSCRPGYVAAECKQASSTQGEPPSSDILLEQIVASR